MNQTQSRSELPSQYLPRHQDLDACVADLTALWYLAAERGPQVKEQAKQIFANHPNAKEDLDMALGAQREMRTLLGYATGPAPTPLQDCPPFGTPPEGPALTLDGPDHAAGEPPLTPENPADEPEDTPTEGLRDELTEQPSAFLTAPAGATPTPAGPGERASTTWAPGLLGPGLISGLAATLAVGDTVQLVITRTAAGEVLATVIPQRLNGELAVTCKELQAKGTPLQLDEELVDAMGAYGEVRRTAREVAQELLEATKAAAASAKAAASKTPDASRKKAEEAKTAQQATLTVTANVEGAAVTLKGSSGAHPLVSGKGFPTDPGNYTVRVEAVGYDLHEEAIVLKAKEVKTVQVTLRSKGLF